MTHHSHTPAVLVLEDGRTFRGRAWGAEGRTLGEAVFSTGMTGYQETLTDPSYAGQIVVMTAPHVGNTGTNLQDDESRRIWVAGYAVRDSSRVASNWRSEKTLDDLLAEQGVVGIRDIDTRAVTRHLRDAGAMRAGIFSGQALEGRHADELLEEVRAQPPMAGRQLAETVTAEQAYTVEPADHGWDGEVLADVAAIDLGLKAMTPTRMAERGLRVHVLPASTTAQQIRELGPDGVFMSNGPGDPETAEPQIEVLRDVLRSGTPFFGICFGNQLLGRALGFGTYKLPFGHRGINQPVLDRRTGKVEITAHNHGFAVDAPLDGPVEAPAGGFGRVEVSHIGLNDRVVEGLNCLDIPAFSVQYHPEAAAGPHDAAYLFDRFVDMLRTRRPFTGGPAGDEAAQTTPHTASQEATN
ncbi:glutamine-hydrolyzing carbamoyl-phosphate synthase small subunit [Kocuria palustris]|uniref:glutamine-hydrolyzing carbamoyl-phosphate synthase small subunit n=1 Tax=Kocuria palustris TaxID=71999 RepID=UPI0011A1D002|nr:glutamine-hydrolyzing carbamoyl-phosphate synthase small subunit [Kocuria palustris]